jgi:chemotaxis protein CheZ
MTPEELSDLAARLAQALKPAIRENVREILREELACGVPRISAHDLAGDGFFQRLNEEIMGRLGDIYREISSFQGPASGRGDPEEALHAGELMDEASHRLDQVIQATEKATFEIIELVERGMGVPDELLALFRQSSCDAPSQEQAALLCQKLSEDMVQIMTCLSFQDLTGQRIKRIVGAIKNVEAIVLDLYLSTGLKVRAHEEAPEKDLEQINAEATQKVNDLKGPQQDTNQASVDDLLASLGL